MKTTIIQTDIRWNAPSENISAAEEIISSIEESDLIVLPEMWNTGFDVQQSNFSLENQEKSLQWMVRMAQQKDAAVCGSMAVMVDNRDNNIQPRYRNRLYFVKPDGTIEHYDKHHLFSFGGEDRLFSQGQQRTIVEWRGWRWLLNVCYDLRFPMWMRWQDDYDAIIVVANWLAKRSTAWEHLTCARAIENQCFVVACNRTGNDPECEYKGMSRIVDPNGEIVAQCGGKQQAITAELSIDNLRHYRQKFNFLKDRDNK